MSKENEENEVSNWVIIPILFLLFLYAYIINGILTFIFYLFGFTTTLKEFIFMPILPMVVAILLFCAIWKCMGGRIF